MAAAAHGRWLGLGPPFAGWLQVARRYLVPPLCTVQSQERLLTLGALLPGSCQGALEFHLGAGGGAVDLSIRVETPEQARQVAELLLPTHLSSFLKQWSDRDGPFSSVPCIWLEFDLDSALEGFPTPSVCARLPRHAAPGWVAETLLPALSGERLSPVQDGLVRRCHGEIPGEGSLLYVFSLLSRPGQPVRMELFGLDPDAAIAYLHRVAPHTALSLTEIAPIFSGVDRPHLSFDIGHEILPRVGLEGSFARQREPRWADLLDRLAARGLCTPAEREAIEAWPGYDSFWTAAADWPLESAGPRGFCARALSHVKVVAQPGRAPEAKAYLLVSHLETRNEAGPERAQEAAGGVASSTASRSVFST